MGTQPRISKRGLRDSLTIAILIAMTGCSLEHCDTSRAPAPVEKTVESGEKIDPDPTPIQELARSMTGRHLANGVVWRPSTASQAAIEPRFAVALFGQSPVILDLDGAGRIQGELSLDSAALGGLYHLGADRGLGALEFGGDRLWQLTSKAPDGALAVARSLQVCQTPRVMAVEDQAAQAWILCRDAQRRLVRVDLQRWQAQPVEIPGSTPADVALAAGGERLFVANLASHDLTPVTTADGQPAERIPVETEPYRVIASPDGSPGRLLVLHANNRRVSWVDTDESRALAAVELPHIPTHAAFGANSQVIFVLAAGAGKLMALVGDELIVEDTAEVAVGAADLAWSSAAEVLWVSTGNAGGVEAWRWEEGRLTRAGEHALGAAAGRLYLDPRDPEVWLTGPLAGRVARYRMDTRGEAKP